MVFQDEEKVNWFWPLNRSFTLSKSTNEDTDDHEKWDRERGFEIADIIEKGLARETVTEFMEPMGRANKLYRFRVERSKDSLQYRLFSDARHFLMYAQVTPRDRKVEFFLYNPSARDNTLYNSSRPTFSMTWSKDQRDWLLVSERCEHCQFSPKQCSCACHGKQQVAFISHGRVNVGSAAFHTMDINIPGLNADGSHQVWCPLLGKGDLAEDDGSQALQLVTQVPEWDDSVGSLVLDFKGRDALSSAKNFQLLPEYSQKPEHMVCQYAKIGLDTFALDFRYPLNLIQAFGASLTTMFWQ